MLLSQFLVMLGMAAVMTPLAISYIPRARQSPEFDRLLWPTTLLMGFMGAWVGLGYWGEGVGIPTFDSFLLADVPIIPTLLGAAVGTVLLNGSLWVIDHLPRPARTLETDDLEEEEVEAGAGESHPEQDISAVQPLAGGRQAMGVILEAGTRPAATDATPEAVLPGESLARDEVMEQEQAQVNPESPPVPAGDTKED